MNKHTRRRRQRRFDCMVSLILILLQTCSHVDATTNPSSNNPSATTSTSCVVHPTGSSKTPALSGEEPRSETKNQKKRTKEKDPSTPDTTASVKVARTNSSKSSSSSLSSAQSIFVRRIQREWKDAVKMNVAYDWVQGKPIKSKKKSSKGEKTDDPKQQYFCLGPLGSNLFVWHFSFLGMDNSTYDGGIYHGRLILPANYPSKPPRVQVWTPSGRYIPKQDICLSASAFHPEAWNPGAFNLRTLIESLRLHILTPPTEIGGTTATPEKRQKLARQSRSWKQQMTSSSSRKRGLVVANIDHARMIQQGVFPARDDKEKLPDTGNNAIRDSAASEDVSNETDLRHQTAQKVKTKKRRKIQKEAAKRQSVGLIALTVKAILNNRLLRMAIMALFFYKIIFG